MLIRKLVTALIVATSSASAAGQAEDLRAVGRAILPATVAVSGTTKEGKGYRGSGFLVDASGIVVTNVHVIAGLSDVRVELANGDSYALQHVRAVDIEKDIVILQVAGFNLPSAKLGDSDGVEPGQPVVLVGSPLGSSGSMSSAIVSAVRRVDGYRIIQTDAPASPGSSGGPMVGLDGLVIGVVCSKIKQGESLTFVIPINYVRGLMQFPSVRSLAQLNEELATAHSTKLEAPKAAPSSVGADAAEASPTTAGAADATVWIYRSRKYAGSAYDPVVFWNGAIVASMDNGRFFRLRLPPGRHVIRVNIRPEVVLELTPGERRYFRISMDAGFATYAPEIDEVDANRAARDVEKLKPLSAEHLKHRVAESLPFESK